MRRGQPQHGAVLPYRRGRNAGVLRAGEEAAGARGQGRRSPGAVQLERRVSDQGRRRTPGTYTFLFLHSLLLLRVLVAQGCATTTLY